MIHLYQGHPDQAFGPVTYAQHGDDLMLLNLFNLIGVAKPSYLDIGAHDPETISNTKLLYLRGSRGVNVDASADNIAKFAIDRPGDINLCYGVIPHYTGERVTLHRYSPTSGRNTLSLEEVESLKEVLTVKDTVRVDSISINMLVAQCFKGKWPNLLSVDIEGLDFDVIQSADFSNSMPDVIVVETRRHDSKRMAAMLEERGYITYCRMGENLFFVQFKYLDKVY